MFYLHQLSFHQIVVLCLLLNFEKVIRSILIEPSLLLLIFVVSIILPSVNTLSL